MPYCLPAGRHPTLLRPEAVLPPDWDAFPKLPCGAPVPRRGSCFAQLERVVAPLTIVFTAQAPVPVPRWPPAAAGVPAGRVWLLSHQHGSLVQAARVFVAASRETPACSAALTRHAIEVSPLCAPLLRRSRLRARAHECVHLGGWSLHPFAPRPRCSPSGRAQSWSKDNTEKPSSDVSEPLRHSPAG